MSLQMYAKAIVAVLVAAASAAAGYWGEANYLRADEWINVAIAATTAAVVFTAPNVPFAPVTKSVLAMIMAGLTAAASYLTDGVMTGSEWLQIFVAIGGAVAVWAVPNTPNPVLNARRPAV